MSASFRNSNRIRTSRSIEALALAALILLSTVSMLGFQVTNRAWAIPGTLSQTNTFGLTLNARLAVSGSSVYAVWFDTDPGTFSYRVFLARSTDGGSVFEIGAITDASINSYRPVISVSNNDIFIAWRELDTNAVIVARASDADPSASIDEVISTITTLSFASDMPIGSNPGPQVVLADNGNLTLAWEDSGDIFVAEGPSGGTETDFAISNISEDADFASSANSNPQMTTFENNIYVTWQAMHQESSTSEIALAVKKDGESSFTLYNLTEEVLADSFDPDISSSSDIVTIVWREFTNPDALLYNVTSQTFTPSTDDFGVQQLVSSPSKPITAPMIGAPNGGRIFVSWQENNPDGMTGDIVVSNSNDGGDNFECATKVSGVTGELSADPQVIDSGSAEVYGLWQDVDQNSFAENIIFDPAVAHDSEFFDSNIVASDPIIWGLDDYKVTVSGRVANTDPINYILVDWGDTETTNIDVSECSWEATHVYDSSDIGAHDIAVNLVDGSDDTVRIPGATFTTNVISHEASLTLNPIQSVNAGSDIAVSGLLNDETLDAGIEGMEISFTGTGAELGSGDGLSAIMTTTLQNGSFFATAPSPSTVDVGWTVMAHFAGGTNLEYQSVASSENTYNTLDTATVHYSVINGTNREVPLPEFDAKITFQNVLTNGTVGVLQCTASDTARFTVLGDGNNNACLIISPLVDLLAGSFTLLEMSLGDLDEEASNINVFLEQSPDNFVDLTAIRDEGVETVTANTTQFGMFVAGIARHDSQPVDSLRKQVLLGHNEVSLRNIANTATDQNATITSDKTQYRIGDIASIQITDPVRNRDSDQIENVNAIVKSTADTTGINLVFTESGADTGVFRADLAFSTDSSSSSPPTLKISNTDTLSLSYTQGPAARLFAKIDGIVEAGVIDISDISLTSADVNGFARYGDAVGLDFVDTQLGIGGKVNVTMSYANVPLGNQDEELMGIYQRITLPDGDGNPVNFWNEITQGVNTSTKTVSGTSSTISPIGPNVFVLGYDVGEPGGAGGGIGRPGTGIVLDFVASLVPPASHGGGGSSTNSNPTDSGTGVPEPPPSAGTAGVPAGGEQHATVTLNENGSGDSQTPPSDPAGSESEEAASNEVQLVFENVTVAGEITVSTESLSSFSLLFDSTSGSHAYLEGLNGANYTTVGDIFDIKASTELVFYGTVDVTIPYDMDLILSATADSGDSLDDSAVRFLHYNGSSWEDVTINLNTTSKTVTGRLTSDSGFSPVVAALISDGTFGKEYFEVHPIQRINVTNIGIQPSTNNNQTSVRQMVSINATLTNLQRTSQDYFAIVQIHSPEGYVEVIMYETGQLGRAESAIISVPWETSPTTGLYEIKVFVMSDLEDVPIIIAPMTYAKVLVS